MDYVDEHFVGVAADDVRYANLDAGAKKKGEFRYLEECLRDGGKSLHQGVYVVTSSGKFLGQVATGWPHYDAKATLENLRKAKRAYDAMEKSERVGETLRNDERSLIIMKGEYRPGMMKMVGNARHYNFEGMELFDMRHPVYSKVDRVWFTREEERSMLPGKLAVGEETEVGGAVVRRLLLGSHFQFGCQAWWDEHIKKGSMRSKVFRVEGKEVFMTFDGEFFMDADSKWNRSSLRCKLLGKGIWDRSRGEFTSLEWVTIGDVELGELKDNMHRGHVKKTRVGAVLRLARGAERRMLPHRWEEYPKSVRSLVNE